ncbi:S-layer homology domain-containing protein [Cytobacillus firmus]|uniref:S-layer homology domain-containing protein n=1 Tax=Cytobacillus firmus TaxID=1399 RepID=UPI00384BD694
MEDQLIDQDSAEKTDKNFSLAKKGDIMRRFLTIPILIVCLFIFKPGLGHAEFDDISKDYSFYDEIQYLTSEKVISGFPDGKFKPGYIVTRAQAAIMIGRALGLNGDPRDTEFIDVNASVTGSGYIASAVEENIITGFTNGTYRPNEPVTRGQMAIFINRAFKLSAGQINGFRDVSSSMAAYQSILNVAVEGIASGYPDGTYRPGQSVTRGQFSAFMARTIEPSFRSFQDSENQVPIRGIKTSKELTLLKGQESTLEVSILPENAEIENLIWTSSDNSIVSVTNSGKVKGLNIGTAIITASIKGTNIFSDTKVTVKEDILKLEEVYNAEESRFEKYLNQHYSSLPTPLGEWNPTVSVSKEGNNIFIEVDWSGPTPYAIKYSDPSQEIKEYGKVLSDQDRLETKQLLRAYMKNISEDTFKSYPGYYVRGKFYTSGYKYPNLKVGFWSISFLTWNNFNGYHIGPSLKWDPALDDYNFVLDYEIQKVGYYHPQEDKVFFSGDYSPSPIQVKLGEKLKLSLKFTPDELNNEANISYKEMGIDISGHNYYGNIDIDENGWITGKSLGKDTIFVYHPKSSLLINVEVID